ncbi:MAG: HAD family hydrolase [bacterium]
MIKAIFFDFYGVINLAGELNSEVSDFVKANHQQYKFAVLSAADTDLHEWLNAKGIGQFFDIVQTTAEIGISKTAPEFFTIPLKKLNLQADEVLFVDDIETYILVAHRLGFRVVLYDYNANLVEQLKTEL